MRQQRRRSAPRAAPCALRPSAPGPWVWTVGLVKGSAQPAQSGSRSPTRNCRVVLIDPAAPCHSPRSGTVPNRPPPTMAWSRSPGRFTDSPGGEPASRSWRRQLSGPQIAACGRRTRRCGPHRSGQLGTGSSASRRSAPYAHRGPARSRSGELGQSTSLSRCATTAATHADHVPPSASAFDAPTSPNNTGALAQAQRYYPGAVCAKFVIDPSAAECLHAFTYCLAGWRSR